MATAAFGGLKNATSSVSPNGAASGIFMNMRKKLIMCMIKPAITIGSRPHLAVRFPNRPKDTPPSTSPTPIKTPFSPTSCFADSPIALVNPILAP